MSLDDELISAIRRGDKDEVKSLLNKGANPNAPDSDNHTPLFCATIYGLHGNNIEIVELLLEHDAIINNSTGFHLIALAPFFKIDNLLEIIKLFKKYNVDINAKDGNGCTALHLAIEPNIIKKIVKIEVVIALINAGANIELTNKEGLTPLHIAAFHNHIKTFFLLLLYGAGINEKEREEINKKPELVSCLAEFKQIKKSPHLSGLIEAHKNKDTKAISKYINNVKNQEALIEEFKEIKERCTNEQLSFVPECLLDFIEHLSKQYLSEHKMLLLKKDTFRGFISNITGIDTNYPIYDFSDTDVLNMQLTCKHINSKAKEHEKAFGAVKDKSNELLNKLRNICQSPNTALAASQSKEIEPLAEHQYMER